MSALTMKILIYSFYQCCRSAEEIVILSSDNDDDVVIVSNSNDDDTYSEVIASDSNVETSDDKTRGCLQALARKPS